MAESPAPSVESAAAAPLPARLGAGGLAYQSDNPTKIVEIRYCIRADKVLVEVEDQGAGFDPALVPDATASLNWERPSGRGLLLMRYYASWVRHNREGNCVTFCIYPSEPLSTDYPMEELPEIMGMPIPVEV